MPLVKTDKIFSHAKHGKYAVAAFDFMCEWMITGILEAAEEINSPVILMVYDYPGAMKKLDLLAAMVRTAAEKSPVPVALHLDHGRTIEACKRCLDAGFTSIMIDASGLPYDENVRLTCEAVTLCKPCGIPVEAELGQVGSGSEYDITKYKYTDPRQAAEFVSATGVDSLAVAVGNAHGVYRGKPQINFTVLESLLDAVSVPLVLHGGSGIPDEDLTKMAVMGMMKFNFFTELNLEANARLRSIVNDSLDTSSVAEAVHSAFRDKALEKIRALTP